MGRMLVFLAALFFGSLVQNLPDLLEEARSLSEDRNTFLLTLGGILLLFLCFLGYQLLIWAKTWIYVSEGTLVIERRTLNRKVHTIAVRNISNINTEQNLFEMLIGTSKLKLDTNSLSTADKTDVRIVLKTSDAEAFRSYLLSLLHPDQTDPAEGEHDPEHLRPAGPDTYDIHAGLTDICAHGIFSISLLSVLVLAGCVLGTIGAISDTVQTGFSGNGPVGFLVSLLLVLGIFFSALWDILRGFIQYYDFRATRAGDRILIQYGLLKKSSYTIPVDKIQALKLNQSPLARLTGRYMAEIINVGMGDEASERNSFLVLYCKKDILRKRLTQTPSRIFRSPGCRYFPSAPVCLECVADPRPPFCGSSFCFLPDPSTISAGPDTLLRGCRSRSCPFHAAPPDPALLHGRNRFTKKTILFSATDISAVI